MFLITSADGNFIRWSKVDDHEDGEVAQEICDRCVDLKVDWEEAGPAECTTDHKDYPRHAGYRVCPACRDDLEG